MRKERVGFAVCGSFCTHQQVLKALEALVEEYETVIPIVSENAAFTDTRFGTSDALMERLEELTGHEVLCDIPSVEPIGPKGLLDILVVAPATGNTVAKLAAGITDTAVTMAVKAHLRNGRPVVIALASNDGLAAGARNIGELLVRRNYYFVPFGQDNPVGKPSSLVADFSRIPETVVRRCGESSFNRYYYNIIDKNSVPRGKVRFVSAPWVSLMGKKRDCWNCLWKFS